MYTCKNCKIEKSKESFYKSTKTKSGYRGVCKDCASARQKEKRSMREARKVTDRKKELPSIDRINELFEYDGNNLIRKVSRGCQKAGSIAGKVENNGYIRVNVDGELYLAHRLIWKMVYSEEPDFLDHINMDKSDNRIDNLRVVTLSGNCHNRLRFDGESGLIGVNKYEYKRGGLWVASFSFEHEHIHIGYYECVSDAVAAYNKKAWGIAGEMTKNKINHNIETLKSRYGIDIDPPWDKTQVKKSA
jgi:hypothetical protein